VTWEPGRWFFLLDDASAAVMLLLALVVLARADRAAPGEAAVAAAVVAGLAACDLLGLHAQLARLVAGLLPFETVAGRPVVRVVKLLVLAQLVGSAATLLLLACGRWPGRPLLVWLAALTAAGAVTETATLAVPTAGATLAWIEEAAELAVGLVALAWLGLPRPAGLPEPVPRP
jgi:hypothetical protein